VYRIEYVSNRLPTVSSHPKTLAGSKRRFFVLGLVCVLVQFFLPLCSLCLTSLMTTAVSTFLINNNNNCLNKEQPRKTTQNKAFPCFTQIKQNHPLCQIIDKICSFCFTSEHHLHKLMKLSAINVSAFYSIKWFLPPTTSYWLRILHYLSSTLLLS